MYTDGYCVCADAYVYVCVRTHVHVRVHAHIIEKNRKAIEKPKGICIGLF